MTNATSTLTTGRARRGSLPLVLVRLEGAAILAGAIAVYADAGWSWLAFVGLLLAPDLGMIGYLANPRFGAALYNTIHFYGLPVLLGVIALLTDTSVGLQIAIIWIAHIAGDRALGYGLKYPSGFQDTHLQRL